MTNFIDMLEVEGIDCKGFGKIPKYIMTDKDISIKAKAIYAYLCSYTGAGSVVFPSRHTILKDLKISKNTYYNHFNMLIKNGYITIKKKKGFLNKNFYTLVANPQKIKNEVVKLNNDLLLQKGIYINGYGTIAKMIMQDERINITEKAIISYFYSCSQGVVAFPSVKCIISDLQISENTYYKSLNTLIKLNYIAIEKNTTDKGKFLKNNYILVSNPELQIGQNNYQIRKAKKENFIKKIFKNHTSKTGTDHTSNFGTTDKNHTSKIKTNRTSKTETNRTSKIETSNNNKNYYNSNYYNTTKYNHHLNNTDIKKDDDNSIVDVIKSIYNFGIESVIKKSTTLINKAVDTMLMTNMEQFHTFSNDKEKINRANKLNSIYKTFVSALKSLLLKSSDIRAKIDEIISHDTDYSQPYNSSLIEFACQIAYKFYDISKTTKINNDNAYMQSIINTHKFVY